MKNPGLAVATLALLHGCASGGAPAFLHGPGVYARSASAPSVTLSSSTSVTTAQGPATNAEAPSPPQEGPSVADAAPSARPGLATAWGEALHSRVRYAPFERAAETPFDTATLWYNDARMLGMQVDHAAAQAVSINLGPRFDGVRVSLRGEYGDPLQGVAVNGRTFVLGEAGQRYTILLENRTGASFEALVTVDGLDVINGQPGSFSHRGYVLRPYGQVEVRGFRQSLERVAAFRFGSVGASYAASQGDARNVGVIGVALFAERGERWDPHREEVERREQASPFPNGFAPPPRW